MLIRQYVFALALLLAAAPASAVVYLADQSLESMIVASDCVAVGKVTLHEGDRAELVPTATLKGDEHKTLTLNWPRREYGPLSVTDGERVLVFAAPRAGKETVLARMPLRSDAEEKTIIACYGEITPHAALLADLADRTKTPDLAQLRPALNSLAESKNAFTQIILGRLMNGPLTTRVDPTGNSAAILAGLKSTHAEFTRGAASWAGQSGDATLVPALTDAAKSKDALLRTLAQRALDHLQPATAPAATPPTQAASTPAPRKISEFKSSRDGFAFANNFPGFASKSTLFDKPGEAYGLCGGMAFAATDYFLSREPIPADKTAPQKNTPLWLYLYRRQLDSVGDGQVAKFIQWSQLEDTGKDSLAARTVAELAAAVKKLDAGEPALLGLIISDSRFAIFENHQVVALGYEIKGRTTILKTYDPNYPRSDLRIITAEVFNAEVTDEKAEKAEKIMQAKVSRGTSGALRPIRGFFVMPYKPAVPPKEAEVKSN